MPRVRLFSLMVLAFLVLNLCLSGHVVGQDGHEVIDQRDRLIAINAEFSRLYNANDFNRALETAKRAVAIGEASPGGAGRSFGTALNNLALVYLTLGRYSEAESIFLRALTFRTNLLGHGHADVALTLNDLAGVYTNQDRFQEAEGALVRSLAIQAKLAQPNARDFVRGLNNLADILRRQERFGEAETLFRRALEIVEKLQDDTYVGQILNNLAVAFQTQGRYIEAEPLLKRALAANVKRRGPKDVSVGISLGNLASLFRNLGRYAEAETLFKRSISILEKPSIENDIAVATSLNNLASLYQATGRGQEAKLAYQRSLAIREKTLPADHSEIGQSLNNLATLHEEQGNFSRAEELFRQAISIFEASRGEKDIEVGKAMNNLAELYRSQAHYAKALPLYQKSLEILETKGVAFDEQVAVILSNLAGLYASLQSYKEAEDHYKRAIQMFERALGSNHPDLGKILKNLADFYRLVGRRSDEAEVRARLAKLPLLGTRHVPLFFVTNRTAKEGQAFGSSRVDSNIFGEVVMRVPTQAVRNRAKRLSESLGQLEMARAGELTRPEHLKRVRIRQIGAGRAFAGEIRSNQQRASVFRNHALIFVHGYNNTFEGAMQRATQVSFDLQYDGILLPFTWPSRGAITGYFADNNNALSSVESMVSFLDEISESMPDVKLHFLAHSMGNQVMLRALCKIAKRKSDEKKGKYNFGQVISAHADVSYKEFEELTNCFKSQVEGITLYVNEKDTALRIRCGGFRCRAGNYARGYSSADVIDTTAMGKGFWRTLAKGFDHDVFVRSPLLFGDIARLLLTGQRPVDTRTQEFRQEKDSEGHMYWVYDKSLDPAAQPVQVAEQ